MNTTTHEIRIVTSDGDTQIDWVDVESAECVEAQRQFEAMIKQGFLAYRTDKDGEPAEVIAEFDPNAHRITMVPRLSGG